MWFTVIHMLLPNVYYIGDCGTTSHITNGSVTIRATKEVLMADYSCNSGYILVGNKSIICNSDGKWTETSNHCG